MKRNLYAVLLLAGVTLTVLLSGGFLSKSTARILDQLDTAYQYAQAGRYADAEDSYREAAKTCNQDSHLLYLLVRRSLLDEINESLAILEHYAQKDNFADLSVETARVTEQLHQLQDSFLAAF